MPATRVFSMSFNFLTFGWLGAKRTGKKERETGCCLCRVIFRTEPFTQKQAPRQHCHITKKGGGCFATGKHKENRKNRRRSSPRADKVSPQDVSSHLTTSWRERSLRPRHRLEEPQWPEPRGTGLQACKARWRWLRRRREDCADPETTCDARWDSGRTPSSTFPRWRQWSTESSSTYFESKIGQKVERGERNRIVRIDTDVCQRATVQELFDLFERRSQDLVVNSSRSQFQLQSSFAWLDEPLPHTTEVWSLWRGKMPLDTLICELGMDAIQVPGLEPMT